MLGETGLECPTLNEYIYICREGEKANKMWQEVFLFLKLRYNIRTVGSRWKSLVVKLKMSGRPRKVSSTFMF